MKQNKKKLDHYGKCPKCNKSWDNGKIVDTWKKMNYYKNKSDKELEKMAKSIYSEPYHFSKIIGIEIREKYDGISYWKCPFCETIWNKWNEKVDKKEISFLGKVSH